MKRETKEQQDAARLLECKPQAEEQEEHLEVSGNSVIAY